MLLAAGLDVAGSSVKAWVADVDGNVRSEASRPLPVLHPARHRAELDPAVCEAASRQALSEAVARAPAGDWLGLTVSTVRQAFVLLDADGGVLGNGVLASDRRGAPYARVLAPTCASTGQPATPELTLAKLLAVRAEEPDRWAAVRRVLFLHDWLVARMTGVHVTEASYACAGGMADVAARGWAVDLLRDNGICSQLLAPVVEAGTLVGELLPGWPLPVALPVVAGCGDTQLAATGAGGLADGVLTVVADSSTSVQVAVAAPVVDPLAQSCVSTHAAADLWAVEVDAAASSAALLETRALAVRAGVEDLERVLGRRPRAVVVCGSAAADGVLPRLLADVLGRELHHAAGTSAAAGAALVAQSVGAHAHVPGLPATVVPAGDASTWDAAYGRWRAARRSSAPYDGA